MYELEQINKRAFDDPEKFVRDCCDEYEAVIESVAEDILNNLNNSRVVLLSGPSGSTKTTTAKKICDRLLARGHSAHEVSLDNYLLDVTPENTPILPDGRYDLESPDCLDMSLLLEHFDHIEDRKEIKIPKFDFHTQCRLPEAGKVIRPDENTIVIFEGIHALNKDIAFEHPQAYTLFVNADPDISYEGRILVSKDDVRFARRTIRDDKFRGHSFAETYKKRDTVIRGENLYILPSAETAARKIDSFHPCELGVYRARFLELMRSSGVEDTCCTDLHAAFVAAVGIREELVPADSVLREFLGGGSYVY
ncbi:MAG: nucleoside kinase [Clostridiales bacterium]|nr:nucleoside kinase [Clostridiales bacterium]